MSFYIKLSDEARLDLSEANAYYFSISKSLNAKFNQDIFESIDRIALNPDHFQKRYRNIKIVFSKTFPFGIHYLVEEDTIYVQRILHQKRLYR